MPEQRKKVFISYSHRDYEVVNQIRAALISDNNRVWLDMFDVQPGDSISTKIDQGIKASDYFILVISESSNQSEWVKREIATAFDLANQQKISVVPFLTDEVEVPFEMRGLLYIDARKSVQEGIQKLVEFFQRQITPIMLLGHTIIRKSIDASRDCQNKLQRLASGDLRFHLATRLSLNDIKVLWFDVFERKMDDEIQVHNVGLSTVELIDRCTREDLVAALIEKICRNHPRLYSLI